ncbi:hypothetical protein QUB47_33650 [Microcoleus sp. AT9_B5]
MNSFFHFTTAPKIRLNPPTPLHPRSKFDKPDRPAADIYLQLLNKHHFPKSTEGKNGATTGGLPLPASKSTGNSSTGRNTPASARSRSG